MAEIYLIRHTQAEGNRYRMMQGAWDGSVTEKGRAQIESLAERFRDVPLDAVYSSDLTRAVMTAEATFPAISAEGICALMLMTTEPSPFWQEVARNRAAAATRAALKNFLDIIYKVL